MYIYRSESGVSCGQTLSCFIFRPSLMQVDIADRRNDYQLMYNKGKQLAFTSNTENVFFCRAGQTLCLHATD